MENETTTVVGIEVTGENTVKLHASDDQGPRPATIVFTMALGSSDRVFVSQGDFIDEVTGEAYYFRMASDCLTFFCAQKCKGHSMPHLIEIIQTAAQLLMLQSEGGHEEAIEKSNAEARALSTSELVDVAEKLTPEQLKRLN